MAADARMTEREERVAGTTLEDKDIRTSPRTRRIAQKVVRLLQKGHCIRRWKVGWRRRLEAGAEVGATEVSWTEHQGEVPGRSLRGQAGRRDISKEPLMCPYKKLAMAAKREPNALAQRKALPLV